MRTILLISLVMSFSAFAQTRVKENIKQSAISSQENENSQESEEKIVKGSRDKKEKKQGQ
ncbi:MAG: hypothetical protein NDI69_07820 [Bacteriovoracaceae bacterium]|nr:hypothetical protein [Bacteriovoracaceae bacterium]